ncbi:diguanylate cyclase [Thermosynechococcaceae cyanobacterium BACA0444]|uniref:Diguanylate cyclase n=1 Tax=Pseudocalidococcus azoricus BACA0444 TaxID=2918990 RepID=A0AAE4FQU9_9CYAN|nr:diguanylate cyclase [Pseudocalidococcus azoricus]MDS3859852.1 diguanylate cyclase [Pseudocalidococcus azoricus BACA0444]
MTSPLSPPLASYSSLLQVVKTAVQTITPQATMHQALQHIQRDQGNCLPVIDPMNGMYRGLVTERELVKAIAHPLPLAELTVADVMRDAQTHLDLATLDQPMQVLHAFRQFRCNALPVVDRQGRLQGILNRQDFRNTLEPTDLLKLKRAEEVMVSDVRVISPTQSLAEAAAILGAEEISCLVVVREAEPDYPLGILTDQDILNHYQQTPNSATLPIQACMNAPVITAQTQDSIWQIHTLMAQHQVRRIVIVNKQGKLAGLVTQSSILWAIDSQEAGWIIDLLQIELQQATSELRASLSQHQALTAAIVQRELQYNKLLGQLPAVIYQRSLEPDWRLIYTSGYWETLSGYRPGMIGEMASLILPEDYERAKLQIQSAILQKQPYVVEYRCRHRNGTLIWIQDRGQREPDQQILSGILLDVTAQRRQEELLQRYLQRELLISTISQNIRRSLDLTQVMQSAADDVRQILQTDRVLVFRLLPNGLGVVEVESLAHTEQSILGRFIQDPCFLDNLSRKLTSGYTATISDSHQAKLHPCHRELLLNLNVRANLVVSIHQNERIWGLLIAHQCHSPRLWLTDEILLLQRIGEALAIAVNQAELYQQLAQANQELQQLVYVDGLTQIGNRRQFTDLSLAEWRRAAREQTPISLVLVDIDYFKLYNDHYGHQQGDAILYRIAQQLAAGLQRPGDLATRYGGEEFALILPDTPEAGAIQVVEQIQEAIVTLAIPHAASPITPHLTLSFGIATLIPQPTQALDLLLTAADQALYQAKAQGRNTYRIHSPTTVDIQGQPAPHPAQKLE